jgi:short-subunit dehydrogenase
MEVDKAAKKIYKAIIKQKPEVLIGKKELLMVYIKRFFPAISRKLVRKIKPE